MLSKTNNEYLTNREWLMDVMSSEDVILCNTSALECLGLFSGYLNEKEIDVYAKEKGIYDNVNYYIVDTFDGIDVIRFGSLKCTSVNQTINDMLSDFDNIDEQPLVEALSNYYFTHNKSFDGLVIESRNHELFNSVKDWALEYHKRR